jgi:RimJ/RimL family protein N-acetyltransferase
MQVPFSLLYRASLDPEVGGLIDPYSDRERVAIVADGCSVGFFSPRRDPDGSARLGAIYVLPAFRGRGLARKAIEQYVASTPGPFRAWIADQNLSSQRAFASCGFVQAEAFGEGHWWAHEG